jgi:hypothetical protein
MKILYFLVVVVGILFIINSTTLAEETAPIQARESEGIEVVNLGNRPFTGLGQRRSLRFFGFDLSAGDRVRFNRRRRSGDSGICEN